jgi:hypothetical protein
MVRCNNDTDGPNRRIHYSGEFAALPAEEKENQRVESHELNDKKGVASQRTIQGTRIHNSKNKATWPT